MSITQEQTEYYNDLEAVFALPGWKRIIEEAEAQIYQNQADALEALTWEDVLILRGKSLNLNDLIKLEMISNVQREQLEMVYDDADI